MPRLSETLDKAVNVVSDTFPVEQISQILQTPGIYFGNGHFLYPAPEGSRSGTHLDAVFLIEPISDN